MRGEEPAAVFDGDLLHGHSTPARRALRRATEQPITEGRSDHVIRVREAVYRRGLMLADVFAAGLALVICSAMVGDDRLQPAALLALALIVVVGKGFRLYERDELVVNKTTMDQAPQLFQCAAVYTLLVVLLSDTFVAGDLGSAQVLMLWTIFFVAAILTRRVVRWLARSLTAVERCLFVGTEDSYERLLSKLPEGDKRAQLVARMSLSPSAGTSVVEHGAGVLHRMIEDLDVHRVIIEPSEALPQITLDFVREAKATGVRVSLLPRILEVVGSTIEVDDVNGLTLLGVRRFGLSRSSRVTKRCFDTTAAAAGLVLTSPLLLVIAILIKLDSGGPVVFRQTRVGRDGQMFKMRKFRTMVDGADSLKSQLRVDADAADGLFKIADDPRITRVGRILRRSSLDELPQLINVLRGEMSLVGPRPLIADEDVQITGLDRSRLQLTPGMTGHWQIQGGCVPIAEMIKLDYLYVAGWSLWADTKILLRTVTYVLARRGM